MSITYLNAIPPANGCTNTRADYCVYILPHNDKWRKFNWPK